MFLYLAYALHVFVWRLCELVWLTHAPLGHALEMLQKLFETFS